jgi:site-specific DNA recombinase
MRDLDISYLRVSTLRQRDEETIETQRYALDRYFEREGVEVPRAYRFEDDGVSGGIEIHKRPAGAKVYGLVAAGRVRRLFLFHSDRVGRDTIDTLLFHRLAETNGTQIIGAADGTDTFREGSTLTTEIRAVIAAEYRRDCSRRTKAGLRRRAAAGLVSTHAPFGYALEAGRLVIVEERAAVMARAFAEVHRGERTREIVARLNSEGVPSPRGRGWRHDTLLYLLKHEVYAGAFVAFRTPRRQRGGGKRIARAESERVVIPCPAIITRELFDAVQERIAFNRNWSGPERKNFYLLKSVVRCGKCGRAYIGHTIAGRKYKGKAYPDIRYYECGTLGNRDYEFCRNARVNAERLERAVWDEIETFMRSPANVIGRLTEVYNRQTSAAGREATRRLKVLSAQKEKNREARERLALAVARGVILDDEVGAARAALTEELARLEDEERRLVASGQDARSRGRQIADAGQMLTALRAEVERGFTPRKRAEIARCLVRQALVSKGDDGRAHVAIQYAFPTALSFSPVGLGSSDSSLKK